jgi:HPt (histidine-containing phosphotransfer) domain-containing protein
MNLRKTLTRMNATLLRLRNHASPARPAEAPRHDPRRPEAGDGGRSIGSVTLAQEILARLLLELPDHHRAFTAALQDNDYGRLGRCAHKLAGAVAYCELPALAAALADLRQALGTDDAEYIHTACNAATGCMHALMIQSGGRAP